MDGHAFGHDEDDPREERGVRDAQVKIAEAFGKTFVDPSPEDGELTGEVVAAPTESEADAPEPETNADFEEDDDLEVAAQAALDRAQQVRMAEALLFAAAEPLDLATLKAQMPEGSNVEAAVDAVRVRYESAGVRLVEIDGRWTFRTAPDLAHLLERHREQPKKLSRAATETLAIIAYHQPCTRADIEDVRGVAVSKGSLDVLLEIGWIVQQGRRETPGRPALYVTTPAFLSHFNLASVSELPGLADLKAAGLLDGRLPPGFTVPAPQDAAVLEDETAEEAEFVGEFVFDAPEDSEEATFTEPGETIASDDDEPTSEDGL